ncbi:MAG: SAM-dependent methyltransferase [Steroidobacteraceae bacterium]
MATISRVGGSAMLMPGGAPELTREEALHGEQVARQLRDLISRAGGWIPFSTFMQSALYQPGLGYYATGRVQFGAGGDFVTAPELSPLFARCLAHQCAEILARTDGDVVEFGAGSGRMALDLLTALAGLQASPRRYRIVEISAPLRARQQALFAAAPAMAARVEWLGAPPVEPWHGVAIANEVVDALPVDRFRIAGDDCEALGVVVKGDAFQFDPRPADARLAEAVADLRTRLPGGLPEGYVSEWCPSLPAWIDAAGASLARGVFLIADYGLPRTHYYHPSRDGGTLCGFYRNRRTESVLIRPGLQDLTAWVDFSALCDAAVAAGFTVAGFATQAHALAALGVERELAALQQESGERERYRLAQSVQTLMLPGEMGERFKLLALGRGVTGPLTAFSFRDLSPTL